MKNDAGEEDGGEGRPQRSCTSLRTFPCELVTVAHYRGTHPKIIIEIEIKVPKTTLY